MSGLSGILLNSLYGAEPIFMALALLAILRSGSGQRFRALIAYLTLRLVAFFVLEVVLLHVGILFHVSKHSAYRWYFYAYWSLYIASTVAVFFVIFELFKHALEFLPGLKRLGLVAFRWVAFVSCLAAVASAITPGEHKSSMLLVGCDQLMRCETVFLLCLLLFLILAAGKLGISYGSRVFGVSFGFGIMAASNLVVSLFLFNLGNRHARITTSAASILDTSASLMMLAVWSVYFFRREPARQTIAQPAVSPLARWNEIAIALAPATPRPAFAASSSDFFLQDVEKVVDRILTKNSLNAAS